MRLPQIRFSEWAKETAKQIVVAEHTLPYNELIDLLLRCHREDKFPNCFLIFHAYCQTVSSFGLREFIARASDDPVTAEMRLWMHDELEKERADEVTVGEFVETAATAATEWLRQHTRSR